MQDRIDYHRDWVQFDPILGYRFIKNLYARIFRNSHKFVIQTNAQGFRNNESFDKLEIGKPTVLAIGDSYTAGDGVSNQERFTDILGGQLGFNLINGGLSGSGTDQQLLIQESISSNWDYDLLLFAPFGHNVSRNLSQRQKLVDFATMQEFEVSKPYFTIDEKTEELILHEVSANSDSIKKTNISESTLNQLKWKMRSHFPSAHAHLKKQQSRLLSLVYRANIKKADPLFVDFSENPCKLMKLICERIIQNANSRPIVLVPMPLSQHVIYDAFPFYLKFYQQFVGPNVFLVDILPSLRELPAHKRSELYIPDDGHFTPKGHQIVADSCAPIMERILKKIEKYKPIRSTECPVQQVSESLKPNYILGLSCFYHDSAAVLIRDGEIIAAAQEERFTRIKHDLSFPINSIQYCMEEARISEKNIDAVAYYDNEGLTLERMLATQLYLGGDGAKLWVPSMKRWLTTKGTIWKQIRERIGYQGPMYRALHHRAHAASAFYPSPFDEAAILIVDGVGEWATTTIAAGNNDGISLLREIKFPHSLGLLYSAFTSYCGFKVNSGEYKLMGLAPYGDPMYAPRIREHLIVVKDDGSFRLNLEYFDFLKGERMTNNEFAKLFDGPARIPETEITKRECDIAASIQVVIEQVLLQIAHFAQRETGEKNLVMAGGVALNCVANGKILKQDYYQIVCLIVCLNLNK